jgi:hypothetical protein
MTDKSTTYRESVKALHASVRSLLDACELVKQAEPQSETHARWDSLGFLQSRVKRFVEKRWPRKVLDGLAGCYTDLTFAMQWIQSDTEWTAEDRLTELNHLFVSLARFYEALVVAKCVHRRDQDLFYNSTLFLEDQHGHLFVSHFHQV